MEQSGCGNDFKTDRPMSRRLIVDSIKYWMKEYHVDGFRFDLATMIDRETSQQIYVEAKKINPNVILIAEPWGGGKYDLKGFSDIGWSAWNDLIRNGVKGQNLNDGLGFIFGRFQGSNSNKSLMCYIAGSLRYDGGAFLMKDHGVNYLESHDDHTLGDFIRIANGDVGENQKIRDPDKNAALTPRQMALNKLAAMFLFTTQGPVMIHEGQEYARSKIIAATHAPDPGVGMIDRNSYNKDNETNYLNYDHRDLNRELYDYYRGLIQIRKTFSSFSDAPKKMIKFFKTADDLLIAFRIKKSKTSPKEFVVILNGNPTETGHVHLPFGTWTVIANAEKVAPDGSLGSLWGRVQIPPTSGMILMK
jgi:pullulanase/glycogen debranching enzyme